MDDAIAALAATPAALAQLVADADDARLDDRTREGWSARAILAFFRDAEVLHFRLALERILAEER
ncbi:hypothetical protein, partial [Tepidiforma sp.]|uniref:hypothetical protein n=1 Tax=Tepidiforma sp. TaxID=2682230 RepID=UPI002ADD50F6